MKHPCPSCQNTLTLPDQSAGRDMKCPMCGNKFTVPGAPAPLAAAALSGGPPKRASDELKLLPMDDRPPEGAGPPALVFCPSCGAKWPPGGSACKKCYFNPVLGRKVHLTVRRRFDLRMDTTKIALFLLAAGAAYGLYWLYNNWGKVKHDVDTAYDRTSRSTVTEDSQRAFEKKTPAPGQKTLAASPSTTAGPAVRTEDDGGLAYAKLAPPEKAKLALENLRHPETASRGKARAVELAALPETQPLLIRALEEAVQAGDKESFAFRMALAAALTTQNNPRVARTFTLCLSRKGLSEAQFQAMLELLIPALQRTGAYRQAEVETALREGGWELKAGVMAACARAKWTQGAEVLRALLQNPARPVRRAVAAALADELRQQELIPDLVRALRDEDLAVALLASQALTPYYQQAAALLRAALQAEGGVSLARCLLYARPLLGLREAQTVELFTVRFKTLGLPVPLTPEGIRLGERLLLLKGESERLAFLARLSAGGQIDPPDTLPYVALTLADPLIGVRIRAASALLGCAEPSALEALAYACLERVPEVALYAADAPGAKAAAPAALAVWKAGLELAGPTRVRCAGVLHRMGAAEGAALLHKLAADENTPVSERTLSLRFLGQALNAAERKGASELILSGRLGAVQVMQVQSGLSQAGDDEARKSLYNFLRSTFTDQEKSLALHEIAVAGDARAVPTLLALLRSGSLTPPVVEELCLVLGRFPSKEVWQGLLDAMPVASDATVLALALALSRYKEAAPAAMAERLKSDAPGTRAAAVLTLVLLGTPSTDLVAVRHLKTEMVRWVQAAGLRGLAFQKDVSDVQSAAEWEAILGGGKADLSGKWVKIGQPADHLEYSLPEEMDPKNTQGPRWPGDPSFIVHRDSTSSGVQMLGRIRDRLTQKQVVDGPMLAAVETNASRQNARASFNGSIWKEGERLKVLLLAKLDGDTGSVTLLVDFSCKAAFWEFNKPLLDKLLAGVFLTQPK